MTYISRPASSQHQLADLQLAELSAASYRYNNLQCRHDVQDRLFWCFMDVKDRPSFTLPLLDEVHDVQRRIAELAALRSDHDVPPVSWVVLGSRTPGIFSLGGDLTLFSQKIVAGDREGLRDYAYSCVDIAYRNATAYGGRAVTIGLAQGEALGGGFESLLSCDVIIAERRARFGLPEVLMNMFPGMGAHCFLTRRIGSAAAMRLILSGEVLTAEALHTLGVVDQVVPDGTGEAAAREYVLRHQSRHRAHAAAYEARRRVSPVSLSELRAVCDVWVETAMELSAADLRRMAHLVAAQDRNRKRLADAPQAAE